MPKPTIAPSRLAAFHVLHPVFSEQAILDEAIAQLDDLDLGERDRALANEIIFGTCRHWGKIRHALRSFAAKLGNFPDEIQRILELSAYQLLFLDRVPDYAAVSDAVELCRHCKMFGLTKPVNGILRNLIRNKETLVYPDKAKDEIEYLSVEYSHPKWLVSEWFDRWGRDEAARLCQVNQSQAPLTLRVRVAMEDAAKLIEAQGVSFSVDDRFPDVAVLEKGARIPNEWHVRNEWIVQDPVMTLVARAVDPQPGWSVWDVCAAPGGKAFHMADLMGGKGSVTATDRSAVRIAKLKERLAQLGITGINAFSFDPLCDKPPLDFGPFDAILVDAPCTGWGTFRRNPDLRWHSKPDCSAQLAALSSRLLNAAASRLKPGGVLVYSTCTLSPVENENVVSRFLDEQDDFRAESLAPLMPESLRGMVQPQGWFVGFPPETKHDGVFIARMIKERQLRI